MGVQFALEIENPVVEQHIFSVQEHLRGSAFLREEHGRFHLFPSAQKFLPRDPLRLHLGDDLADGFVRLVRTGGIDARIDDERAAFLKCGNIRIDRIGEAIFSRTS